MDTSTLLTVGGAVATTVLTVVGTIWVARARAKIDVGQAITLGFEALTNQLQEERTQLMEIVRAQRLELTACEKAAATMETLDRRMRRHVATVEQLLEKANIPVPPHTDWE